MRHYYFFGDSVTDSYRGYDSEGLGEGYVRGIAQALHYGFEDIEICNFGQDGFTLRNVAARWEEQEVKIQEEKAKGDEITVSVMVGVNDALNMAAQALNQEQAIEGFGRELTELFQRIEKAGPDRVVIYEPFTCGEVTFGGRWDQGGLQVIFRNLQKLVSEAASERGFTFIATQKKFDQMLEYMKKEELIEDGIHPAPGGHDLLAQLFMKTIRTSAL